MIHGIISKNNGVEDKINGECFPLAFNECYANSLAGDVFFGYVDTTGSIRDIDYVTIKVKKSIVGMDPKNVVQVCFDNVATMKNTTSNINHEWSHIY